MNEEKPIRITSDDLDRVVLPPSASTPDATPPVSRNYGKLTDATPPLSGSNHGILRRSWFYLGLAGAVGSLIAWATFEPFILKSRTGAEVSTGLARYAIPWVVILMCLCFAAAESAVEHSSRKFIQRGAVAIVLGAFLGMILDEGSNIIYKMLWESLVPGSPHPLLGSTAARAVSWAIFGLASGTVYGIADRSMRKCFYGILGGLCGAGLGGLLFDPISLVTGGGAPSRALGLCCFGLCSGVSLGLVENALKERWLYVCAGPLAGKQYILYRQRTLIGSQQSSDIYLFKDSSILPSHVVVELQGTQAILTAMDPVAVNGLPVQERPLRSGDQIQIGCYTFEYRERRKSA